MADVVAENGKRVTFAEEVLKAQQTVLSSQINYFSEHDSKYLTKPSSKNIIHLLKQKQFEILQSYLGNFDPIVMREFFCSKKGREVISYLFSKETNEERYFILKETKDCLKLAIRVNNYEFLINILRGYALVEKCHVDTDRTRLVVKELFRFLLEMDDEIVGFIAMSRQREELYITQKIMEDFNTVLQEFNISRLRFT